MNPEIVMAAARLVLAHSAVFVAIFLATLLATSWPHQMGDGDAA